MTDERPSSLPRIGLGCMRLSTSPERDEATALATIDAAYAAGVRWFDTAHAYGLDETDLGHNERLLARALAGRPARVVTKGGMARPDGLWRPDGRASRIRADAEASAEALGQPIDLWLLHAPDSSTAWATSVRAVNKLLDDGVVRAVGVCNVNLARLDEALALAPISVVQVALSLLDDEPLLSGVLARCLERGLTVMAHSPLGGPKRVKKVRSSPLLKRLAAARGVTTETVALAGVLGVAPNIVAIPGARSPDAAKALLTAASLVFSPEELAELRRSFAALKAPLRPGVSAVLGPSPPRSKPGEIVMLMGLQGAGKSDQVTEWEARGYTRLNRDSTGGTLRDLVNQVERAWSSSADGPRRFVLDNTYVTRASRAPLLDLAARHGAHVHGVWFDTPLHEAQINVIERMLGAHGRLLSPDELKRGRDNTSLPPLAQLRLLRELEVPSRDEGFTQFDVVPFVRRPRAGGPGRAIALEVAEVTLRSARVDRPTLVFGWLPNATTAEIDDWRRRVSDLGAQLAVCVHPDGPPACWCRPPLPGLLLAFGREHGVNWAQSELVGTSSTHEVLGRVVGASVSVVK